MGSTMLLTAMSMSTATQTLFGDCRATSSCPHPLTRSAALERARHAATACTSTAKARCNDRAARPTTFWLNYNPTTDDFSDPNGHTLNPPEQVSVRNEPYRRYGPRSVRAEHDGRYGFYSKNCVSG